jgi:hypothetical protein
MLREQIVSFWGSLNLRRWPVASLRDASLPDTAKSYLLDPGLPSRVDPTFRFGPEGDQLPRIKDRPNYLRIGFDDDVSICLDEVQAGRVMWLGGEFNVLDRYINSDVETYGECLLYFQQGRNASRDLPEEAKPPIVAAVKEKIRRADSTAFADPENAWAVMFEQIEAGLA